jgi:CRISPR-associated protein Cmr5
MKESLDQERARFAWKVRDQGEQYKKLAKGLPALVMQSGLMPVLAFLNDKNEKHHRALLHDLCEWLQSRFPQRIKGANFAEVMSALMGSQQGDAAGHAQFYRMATEESLAILRWIRQFAAAVGGGNGGGPHNG